MGPPQNAALSGALEQQKFSLLTSKEKYSRKEDKRFLICGEHPPEVARLCWIQLPVHQDVRRWLSGGLHAAPQRDLGDSLVFAGEFADQRVAALSPSWGVSRLPSESCLLCAEKVLS